MIYEIALSEMYDPETKVHTKREVLLKTTSLVDVVNCVEGFGYDALGNYSITAYTSEKKYFNSQNLADWLMVDPNL